VADRDWTEPFRERFRPAIVSERFAVAPPWHEGSWPFPAHERLIIYPAMAFGCGSHETTRLALGALERTDCGRRSVLDVGTGSGILAIAAARLGASRIVGLDVDPVAIENALENRRLNDLAARVDLFVGTLDALGGAAAFDVIVANMLSSEFLPLVQRLAGLLKPSEASVLIVSGFLVEERAVVEDAMRAAGLQVHARRTLGEWGGLVAISARAPRSALPS
jgi:ribosomal protein L11 methyltransferase